MPASLMTPEKLPFTTEHFLWKGKPTAMIPGQFAITYEPDPRAVSWTQVVVKGRRISEHEFHCALAGMD